MDQPPPSEGSRQAPLRPEIVAEHRYYPPPRKSSLGRLLLVFVLLVLFGSVVLNLLLFVALGVKNLGAIEDAGRVREEFVMGNRSGDEKIAVISIEGTILGGEGFFKRQIDHAAREAAKGKLKAIVVRVNSPGGTITGSDYMLHHLRELSKKSNLPMVVSMGGIAASGGYYVSMCVGDTPDAIFAEPTTWTGSIGVLIPN
ncbi:MAG: S49 family peptidase, partial [Pirellulaceae bacterium]|nr:S49 family peptidase [Pirellulaceae bacterium]